MRTTFYTLLIIFCATICAHAEETSGRVTDTNGEGIPFATISILSPDSTLLTGAITDEKGDYRIDVPAGAIIQASYIGYQTVCGGPNFVLNEERQQMAEVQVKAKKPLIERQFDKLVLNVSESPIATGSSLNNVLNRAPGVRVDKDGNVTVNGKSVEIYIDGRPSYMSGQQLKGLLDGTDGSTIEKIEIITNPSAKYDASGQGGIINIKLKKNKMQGLNGTLVGSYGGMYWGDIRKWSNQEFFSLNLNYRTDKTYTNVQLTQVYADVTQGLEMGKQTPDTTILTRNEYLGNFQMYSLRANNDWMIDSANTFGFIFQAPVMKFGYGCQESQVRNFMPQHTANLNFTHVFSEALERELTVNVDYNRNSNNSENNLYRLDDTHPEGRVGLLNTYTNQTVDIASAKLDFQTKFWQTGMLETGIKYAFSNTDNQMLTDTVFALGSSRNDFTYAENVAAAYISAAKQWNKVNLKLGLRGEYTYSVGHWLTTDSTNTYSYFNLFPTAFVGYNPTQDWSMSASYTRRIKRATYYVLNPFRTYIDAQNYSEGNPSLTPEFNNDVSLQFGWSHYITLTGTFSHTQDMFNQRSTILPNGDGVMTWYNFGTCTTHGVNASFTEIPLVPKYMTLDDGTRTKAGAWLTMTVNAGYFNFINKSYDGEYYNQSHYWNANANFTAYLPKNWTLSLDGRYGSPMTIGYQHSNASYGMDFGVRKMWPEKGVILNINAQDLMRSSIYRTDNLGMADGYSAYTIANMRQQKASMTVVWMFGQQYWMKQRKVGNLDESSRLGGGTGLSK